MIDWIVSFRLGAKEALQQGLQTTPVFMRSLAIIQCISRKDCVLQWQLIILFYSNRLVLGSITGSLQTCIVRC